MKRILILLLTAPLLSGCATVGDVITAATTPITNPVSATNLYQAKVAFAGSQEAVKKYQQDCFGSNMPPYAVSFAMIKADPVLSVQCAHRVSRYNTMKVAEDKANKAISVADTFISQNPSGNAVSYITAAIKAVNSYQVKAGG